MRYLKFLILVVLCYNGVLRAQAANRVTIHYRDAKLKDVLLGLESKYGIRFYYINNTIPLQNRVSIQVKNASLNEVLTTLFHNTDIEFVAEGNRVVLKKGAPKNKAVKNQNVKKATGEESASGTTLSASVLSDPALLTPAFTPSEVHAVPVVDDSVFQLEKLELLADTSLQPDQKYTTQKNRMLKRYMAKMDSLSKIGDLGGMQELEAKFAMSLGRLRYKLKALGDSLKLKSQPLFKRDSVPGLRVSPAQITFFPPYGTNGVAAPDVTNNVSLNILAGKAYALNGTEFAGLVNMEKKDVKGTQFAGIANIVGTDVKGTQFAGITNVAGGSMTGGQFAGITNVNKDMANGAQFAGVANVNADSATGIQAAGIANVNNGSYLGTQLAGICNVNDGSGAGFQAAGITNVNLGPLRGVQLAGIANVSKDEVTGVQVAGIVNKAKRVRGSQIGLINIADTVTGVTIGLVNIVKNGYNKLEVYGAEALYVNVGFRFGTPLFHTILTLGAKPASSSRQTFLGYGLGFGTHLAFNSKTGMNLDLMANFINEGAEKYTEKLNQLNQLKVHFTYKLASHLSVFAGPTLNVMVSQYKNPDTGLYGSELYKDTFFNETYTRDIKKDREPVNVKMWLGFNAGLRF